MAALVSKTLKYVIIGGTIPAAGICLGYKVRSTQEEENVPQSRVLKVQDLPLYSTSSDKNLLKSVAPPEKDAFDEYISMARKTALDVATTVKETYEIVQEKAQIGVAHTQATLDLIRVEEEDLPRVGFIALAGLAGVAMGYKRGKFKKLVYGAGSAATVAALCYPQKAVDMGESAYMEAKSMWNSLDLMGEQQKDVPQNMSLEKEGDQAPIMSQDIAKEITHQSPKPKGDPGQSNPEDKDMYSTRTS